MSVISKQLSVMREKMRNFKRKKASNSQSEAFLRNSKIFIPLSISVKSQNSTPHQTPPESEFQNLQ